MEKRIHELAADITNGRLSRRQIEDLSFEIREKIKKDPSSGKEVGRLIPLVSRALRQQDETARIQWAEVGGGSLAIGHKPGAKVSIQGLMNDGAGAVLTLLQASEGALAIGEKVMASGMEWIWFPFSASKPHEGMETVQVFDLYMQLDAMLASGEKIYMHCSAGIHRTGMITYGLLRFLGMEKQEALKFLAQLRTVTAEQAGEEKLAWGDQFGE